MDTFHYWKSYTVIVIFHHQIPTKLRFYIKNKEKEEKATLKTSALRTLSTLVNIEDVQSLGLPRQLREDLIDFKLNIWRKGVYMGPGKKIDESKKDFAALFDEM